MAGDVILSAESPGLQAEASATTSSSQSPSLLCQTPSVSPTLLEAALSPEPSAAGSTPDYGCLHRLHAASSFLSGRTGLASSVCISCSSSLPAALQVWTAVAPLLESAHRIHSKKQLGHGARSRHFGHVGNTRQCATANFDFPAIYIQHSAAV